MRLTRLINSVKQEHSCKILYLLTLFMGGSRRGGAGGLDPLKISQNYMVSSQYWSGSPEKSHSYQASIQLWASICQPAKRSFIALFGSSIPHQLKKKRYQIWTPLINFSGSAHTFILQQNDDLKHSSNHYLMSLGYDQGYASFVKLLFFLSNSRIAVYYIPTKNTHWYYLFSYTKIQKPVSPY